MGSLCAALGIASLGLLVLGCNHRPLPLIDDAGGRPTPGRDLGLPPPPRGDLGLPPPPRGDLALSSPDLADACRLEEPNANVTLGGETFTYVWLGNRDSGGERTCGRPTIVSVLLASDANAVIDYPPTGPYARFELEQPLHLGTEAVTITTDDGRQLTAALEVEGFTLYPDDGFVRTLEGKLSADELGLYGPLRAGHCPLLDVICI